MGAVSEGREEWSWGASQVLTSLGFETIADVGSCFVDYDPERLTGLLEGDVSSPASLVENALLAAFGDEYIAHHELSHSDSFVDSCYDRLRRLVGHGVQTGRFSLEEAGQRGHAATA